MRGIGGRMHMGILVIDTEGIFNLREQVRTLRRKGWESTYIMVGLGNSHNLFPPLNHYFLAPESTDCGRRGSHVVLIGVSSPPLSPAPTRRNINVSVLVSLFSGQQSSACF